MDVSFKVDPEIIIGADTISLAGTICSRHGERVMIAADHDIDSSVVNRLKNILEDSKIETIVFDGIHEDSSVDMADNLVELCRAARCTAVIGFGGHKTQVIARMAAIMTPFSITAFELLDGRKCMNKFLPYIAVPTTGIDLFAFSKYFIAADPRDRLVKSVESPDKLYAAVIIDSRLFQTAPGSAAASVFEGFFSAIEAYCSSKANFISDALLEQALNLYAKLLKDSSGNISADAFIQASLLTSLGTACCSPGVCAALAAAVSARCPVEKQVCVSALFPAVAEHLVHARPEKMAHIAYSLGSAEKTATVSEAADSALDGIRKNMQTFNVLPNLRKYGIPLDKLTTAVETARDLDFVSNSPWTVSEEDVFEILKGIL